MAASVGQIHGAYGLTSRRAGSYRAFTKRQTAQRARRLGKRLLDDAPARVTRGWAD